MTLISIQVRNFRSVYMFGHPESSRFYAIIRLFILSIYLLIFSPSLFSLIIGWDCLGVSSYFLVRFYSNKNSVNAGLVTMFVNRVGDVLFIFRIIMGFSLRSFYLFLNDTKIENLKMSLIFLIIIARITKSAQIPFRS